MPLEIQKVVKEAEKEAISYKKMKTQKSTYSQRISPFLWGFILASFAGMYLLIQDLNKSKVLNQRVKSLENTIGEYETLDHRIEDAC